MRGLSEAISDDFCKLTARVRDQTEVALISREHLLEFLRHHQAFCMQIVRLLSENLRLLYYKCRYESTSAGRRRRGKPSDPASADGTVA
ncbi:MAG: hypothetical protein DMG69_02930 [Acidobacteria bacterium]|nr:MAG: hypothetical protein DMG69_02930 [Acidobacteriota bacterium]